MNSKLKNALLATFVAGSFASVGAMAGTSTETELEAFFSGTNGKAESEIKTYYDDLMNVTGYKYEFEAKFSSINAPLVPAPTSVVLSRGGVDYASCELVATTKTVTKKKVPTTTYSYVVDVEGSTPNQPVPEKGSCVVISTGEDNGSPIVPVVEANDIATVHFSDDSAPVASTPFAQDNDE